MIHVLSRFAKINDPKGLIVDTTSKGGKWSQLSPFLLGPVRTHTGDTAMNVENAWQFSKIYEEHWDKQNDRPLMSYYKWREQGWADERAHRYPMGKGRKPLGCYWDDSDISGLIQNNGLTDYIHSRAMIYSTIYAKAVKKTKAYDKLKTYVEEFPERNLYLLDYDAYDHRALGMDYIDVMRCEERKMGHAFVLAMCLEKKPVWRIAV